MHLVLSLELLRRHSRVGFVCNSPRLRKLLLPTQDKISQDKKTRQDGHSLYEVDAYACFYVYSSLPLCDIRRAYHTHSFSFLPGQGSLMQATSRNAGT